MDYETMAQDVIDFCQKQSLDNIALLGHSMYVDLCYTIWTLPWGSSKIGRCANILNLILTRWLYRGGKVAMTVALSPDRPKTLLSKLVVADIAPIRGQISSEFQHYADGMQLIEKAGLLTKREAFDKLAEFEEVCWVWLSPPGLFPYCLVCHCWPKFIFLRPILQSLDMTHRILSNATRMHFYQFVFALMLEGCTCSAISSNKSRLDTERRTPAFQSTTFNYFRGYTKHWMVSLRSWRGLLGWSNTLCEGFTEQVAYLLYSRFLVFFLLRVVIDSDHEIAISSIDTLMTWSNFSPI